MNNSDILNEFSNSHGWFDYDGFNNHLIKENFQIAKLERHNRTDGEVHFRYTHKPTNESFDFNGNYWNAQSFHSLIEWISTIKNKSGL
jgi:hypothetical protein